MLKQQTTDVAVVGAGLLGAMVARACRKSGLDVLVLEADDIAAGASMVRAEAVLDPGEVLLLQGLVPQLLQQFPIAWEDDGSKATWTDDTGTFPEKPPSAPSGSNGPPVASVVDTNRLTVLAMLAAVRGGARLLRREFVSSVVADGDAFQLTASTVSVHAKAVVDATGGEGVAGSFRFSVPDQAPDEVQWLRAERPFQSVVVCHGGTASSSWMAVPDLTHCWIFFPHGNPLQLGHGSEHPGKSTKVRWRSTRPVESSPGYLHPPGMRPGQVIPYASQVAATLETWCGVRSKVEVPPLVQDSAGADGLALSEKHNLPGWVGRRIHKYYGGAGSAVVDAARGPMERSLLCPCEGIMTCELRHVVNTELVTTLDDAARRIDLGEGPCGGTRCSKQAAMLLVEAGTLEAEAFAAHADAFVRSRAQATEVDQARRGVQDEWLAMTRAYGGR